MPTRGKSKFDDTVRSVVIPKKAFASAFNDIEGPTVRMLPVIQLAFSMPMIDTDPGKLRPGIPTGRYQ